ncbi:MAG: M20/M25/M40 family metallo-hydrolase [Myxococcota bacterium]|nr:M20/M25/M40 family metallo-hydrolase [Myxococcota bacterium]
MRWMIWLVMVMSGSAVADDAPLSPAVDGRLADASAVSDPTVRRIIEAAKNSGNDWRMLTELCDSIGARLAGSKALERAVEWSVTQLNDAGAERVWLEPVSVPHWERGTESVRMLHPRVQNLNALGLGGTPSGEVEGEVVVVDSLDALSEAVAGKIVLFNRPMGESVPTVAEYAAAVGLRVNGPAKAAEYGALAAMVRSVTTRSLATPHTGATRFVEGGRTIPAVAITTEAADSIARLSASGTAVKVSVQTGGTWHENAASHNVIGEIRGKGKPREVIVIGAHLDSWDVGQGAHDDGAGVVQVIEALRIIQSLGLRPKRTLRVVLFTNEENGLAGGKAYAAAHPPRRAERHIAAVESDLGGGAPRFWSAGGTPDQLAWLREAAAPLGMPVVEGGGGADIRPLGEQGVLRIGFRPDDTTYFDVHHTAADTLDKVDPTALAESTAALAALAWQMANH